LDDSDKELLKPKPSKVMPWAVFCVGKDRPMPEANLGLEQHSQAVIFAAN
jgi:hypothetical protein